MKTGKVCLIGAGPGDPELLTLKAVRALEQADVVLYDALVDPRMLLHARWNARRIPVGKLAADVTRLGYGPPAILVVGEVARYAQVARLQASAQSR